MPLEWGIDLGCVICRHLHRRDWITCDAFPDGVPHEIMSGEFDHSQMEHPDQQEQILFEMIEEVP